MSKGPNVADAGPQTPGQAARPGWEKHLAACLLIAFATVVGAVWLRFLGPRNLSLPFIVALMLAGSWYGLRPALLAAVSAFLAYNFFLVTPRFSLTIAPADLLALATFMAAAVLVGGMAGQLGDRARSATERLGRLTMLFAASRDLSAATTEGDVAQSLTHHLSAGGGVDAAIWSLGENPELLAATSGARSTAINLRAHDGGDDGGCRWQSLETARGQVGMAAIWSNGRRASAQERPWLDAVVQLGAIALDRARLATEISEARLVAAREGLRTTLLSSLSHDLRTPISTILASASSLVDQQESFDPAVRRDLAETIQEEAERLNLYVSNLLDMTRLESGVLDLRRVPLDPAEAMASALHRVRRRLAGRTVIRRFEAPGQVVSVDPVLLEQALVNVLENAAAFAPPGSTLAVRVVVREGEAALSIEDEGPGISAEEISRIFDKFFRGQTDRTGRAGVGLGLSVARGVVEAFGGRLSAESPVKDGLGTRMTIRLPAYPALEVHE